MGDMKFTRLLSAAQQALTSEKGQQAARSALDKAAGAGRQFGQGKHASTVDKLHRAASEFIDKQNPNGGRAPGDSRGPVDPPR